MLRPLLLAFALASPAHAAQEVRLWHALDPATDAQLARHAAEYNAVQHEFRVRLTPLREAKTPLVRLALPISTARPVLYYNRTKIKQQAAPRTWYDMAPFLGALAAAGESCPYTTARPAWVLLENSGGTLERSLMVRWTSMLASWEKAGYFRYYGPGNEAEVRFAAGECATLTASSDDAPVLAREAHFELGVAPLPYYEDAGVASRPLSESVPVVWAERQSVGVTSFFAFLATRAAAARRSREIMETELEAVWRGEKTAPQALDAYARQLPTR
jgi:ABC-type glycerol-3-phosphate transport system substrate-binding protein